MSFPGEYLLLRRRVVYIGILLLFFVVLSSCTPLVPVSVPEIANTILSSPDGSIPITLLDKDGKPFDPSTKVLVRVSNSTQVDDYDYGKLAINPCDPATQVILAWAEDYKVEAWECTGASSYSLQLDEPLSVENNTVLSLTAFNGSCGTCHSEGNGYLYNEYTEWNQSGHAAHGNGYFENMYFGTNSSGVQSPITQRTIINNELIRTQPSGTGFKLDLPNEPGSCAFCHVPNPTISMQMAYNLPGGAFYERLTCETCHRVININLDENGYPLPDRPGILSFEYLLSNNQYIVGPFANINIKDKKVVHNNMTCSPVFNRSEFCAACHYGKFGDMVIYNSYGEWKESVYGDSSKESDYKTCQDCHMSHIDPSSESLVPFDKRDGCTELGVSHPEYSHNLMNFGFDQKLNRNIPLMIRGAAEIENPHFLYEPDKLNSLGVVVKVTNVKAGHKFPTDSPLRHLILVVEVKDRQNMPLIQTDGKVIPNWGGVGFNISEMENYGGKAGKIYANLLVEKDTNISPTAAYWNPTKLAWINLEQKTDSDTRLKPGVPDESKYYFAIPSSGDVTVSVKLVYRYAFVKLVSEKGWTRPDIVVTEWECKGSPKEMLILKQSCKKIAP